MIKKSAVYLCLFVSLIIIYFIMPRIAVATSPSLDHRVFYKTEKTIKEAKKGDYIQFKLDQNQAEYLNRVALKKTPGEIKAIKIIKGIPGETLEENDRIFSLNGDTLCFARFKAHSGKQLDPFHYKGKIPESSFFVMGTTYDSFDSRYFGFVEEKNVISILHPIF